MYNDRLKLSTPYDRTLSKEKKMSRHDFSIISFNITAETEPHIRFWKAGRSDNTFGNEKVKKEKFSAKGLIDKTFNKN